MVKIILILFLLLSHLAIFKIEKVGNETTIIIGNATYRYYDELIM